MARVVDLTGENITRQRRKERSYGTKTDLSSTTVERGNTHWAEGSNVNIDGFLGVAGTQRVTGLLDVTGTFNGSGTNNMDGTNNLSGDNNFSGINDFTGPTTMSGTFEQNGESTFNGPTHFNGSVDITETLDVTAETRLRGKTTVEDDLEIISGGLFKSGVTKIEPTGKATFGTFIIDPSSNKLIQAPGGWLFSDGSDSIGLAGSSTSSVNLNSARAELVYGLSSRVVARPSAIDLTAPAVHMTGTLFMAGGATEIRKDRLRISELPTITGQTANVYCNPSGVFYRII